MRRTRQLQRQNRRLRKRTANLQEEKSKLFKERNELESKNNDLMTEVSKIRSVLDTNVSPTLEKISIIDAISFQGGGTKSITNFMGVFGALFSPEMGGDPVTMCNGVDFIGGNSGGSWVMCMLFFFDELMCMKDKSTADALMVFDEKWLDPIRHSMYIRGSTVNGSSTDANGIAQDVKNMEEPYTELFEPIIQKLLKGEISKSQLFTIFKNISGIEDEITEAHFDSVIETVGTVPFVHSLVDFLKYLLFFAGIGFTKCWNCTCLELMMEPIRNESTVKFKDLPRAKQIAQQNGKPFNVTMFSTVGYDAFLRFGNPGPADGLKPRYPAGTDLFQYFASDMIHYKWKNQFSQVDNFEENGKVDVVGGCMNQCYTYNYGDGDTTNAADQMKVFNFSDRQDDDSNYIEYAKAHGGKVCSTAFDKKVTFNQTDMKCRDMCENKSVMTGAMCSSAALGIANTYQMLVDIPCEVIQGYLKIFSCNNEQVFEETPLGLLVNEATNDEGLKLDLLKRIICGVTVGQVSRMIGANMVMNADLNHMTEETTDGGISGKYFLGELLENEVPDDEGLYTTLEERKQLCGGDKQTGGMNGIVAPGLYDIWDSTDTANPEDTRFVVNVLDGAPTVNDSGFLPIFKAISEGRHENKKGDPFELVYFQDDSLSLLDDKSYFGLGQDLLEHFGIVRGDDNQMNEELYSRKSMFGVSFPGDARVRTSSPWVLGPKNNQGTFPDKQERMQFLADSIGQKMWPLNGAYNCYDDALDDSQWDELLQRPNIKKDLGKGSDKTVTKEVLLAKLKSMQTGFRIVRIKNCYLRENQAMGTKYIDTPINFTCLCTFTPVWITPIPKVEKRQFEDEFYSQLSLSLQCLSYSNKIGPGKNWQENVFGNMYLQSN